MYTIRHAAEQVGISTATLRAWERRYGAVSPERTPSGYRVYSDADLELLRTIRGLVEEGRPPSLAVSMAKQTRSASSLVGAAAGRPGPEPVGVGARPEDGRFSERFVAAAETMDGAALAAVLDDMWAAASFEPMVQHHLFPALHALGDAWEAGRVSVAGEHFASHGVARRLSVAFEAAGSAAGSAAGVGAGRIVLGLPAKSHHEIALFAFAVAARRRGMAVDHLGADVPVDDWLRVVADPQVAAVVTAIATRRDVRPTRELIGALRQQRPDLVIGVGGRLSDRAPDDVVLLGTDLEQASRRLQKAMRG